MQELDKDTLLHRLKVFEESARNYAETARRLGIARSSVQQSIKRAAETGLSGAPAVAPPPGFLVAKVTRNQKPSGEILSEWVHLFPEGFDYNRTLEAIDEVMEKYRGVVPTIPLQSPVLNDDLATFYMVIDLHLGLYSWEPETGANYDLNIGRQVLTTSTEQLVAQTPNSRRAIILNIGDFFHSDNNRNRTERSGNVLDTDGRHTKILEVGIDLLIYIIELALTKHECVEVRNLPGNHDPYASIALNAAVRMAFRNNPRVHVSRDPSPFYFWRFGKVLVGATHGDMIKHTDMPSVLAAYAARDWGETEHRYVYLGHVHHKSIGGGEKFGATWETFRTLAPKDAWSSQSGFASGRSMVAITHHKDTGEKYRNTVTIAGPGFKVR